MRLCSAYEYLPSTYYLASPCWVNQSSLGRDAGGGDDVIDEKKELGRPVLGLELIL